MARSNEDPTTSFQRGYLAQVRSLYSPEKISAIAVAQQLEAKGISTAGKLERIEKALAEVLSADGPKGQATITLDTGIPEFDEQDISISLDDDAIGAAIATFSEAVEGSAGSVIQDLRTMCLRDVLEHPDERLLELENDRSAFGRNLLHRWKKPLQLFDVQLALALELGVAWAKKLRRRGAKDADLAEVLVRLQARSIRVGGEVRALLHSGFADGALSRWRTMHELAVVAFFIAQEGNETARSYIDHLDADSYKAALHYQRAAPLLGYRVLPQSRVDALKRRMEALKKKYGKRFSEDYGWAAAALKGKDPSFANIEAAVKLDRLRPYFRLASNTVHAGPKGAYFQIGAMGEDILLAGPSNAGLDEAARLAAISLAQITSCLISLRPNLDSGVWSGVLIDIAFKIEAEAVRVQRKLNKDQRGYARAS